jgi:hypothetical protein
VLHAVSGFPSAAGLASPEGFEDKVTSACATAGRCIFYSRELILADGFSRLNTSTIFARLVHARSAWFAMGMLRLVALNIIYLRELQIIPDCGLVRLCPSFTRCRRFGSLHCAGGSRCSAITVECWGRRPCTSVATPHLNRHWYKGAGPSIQP